ncbi:DUF2934 domain-containing protein [uncultured Variovorax sp.]|uniref:DUF2934 domain-containing protein n=1 Tax=uncultured Variovorax sp. TaxID=114708 RepID=UPI0025FC30B0|nr:DUF2934 domain-containing protein [uncultured Variovorax sp.]
MPTTTASKGRSSGAPSSTTATSAPVTTPTPTPDAPLEQPPTPASTQDAKEDAGSRAEREDRVRLAAYEAYVRRGEGPGDPVQDWLEAEAQVDGRRS